MLVPDGGGGGAGTCIQGGAGGGADFEVSQVRMGNLAFQIGHEISHVKSRGFCKYTLCYRHPARGGGLSGTLCLCTTVSAPNSLSIAGGSPDYSSPGATSNGRDPASVFSHALQGVTVALARCVSQIPLSKFKRVSRPKTNLTLIRVSPPL